MIQTIYHVCGHNTTLNMGLSSRQNRIKRAEDMGKSICPPCEIEEMRLFSIRNNLPFLTGSEKQIKWALKIRHIKLTGKYKDFWDKSIAECKFWIDNRNKFKQPLT